MKVMENEDSLEDVGILRCCGASSYWRFEGPSCFLLQGPWRRMHDYSSRLVRWHSITSQKTVIFSCTDVRTTILWSWSYLWHCRYQAICDAERTALSWVITQRAVIISYRHFGTTYRSHLQCSRIQNIQITQFVLYFSHHLPWGAI